LRSDFMAYHLVCDENKYAFLCRQSEADVLDEEYFPQYRRSLIHAPHPDEPAYSVRT
jgi:hypothetical protein